MGGEGICPSFLPYQGGPASENAPRGHRVFLKLHWAPPLHSCLSGRNIPTAHKYHLVQWTEGQLYSCSSVSCHNLTYNGRYSWTNPRLPTPPHPLYNTIPQHSYGSYWVCESVPILHMLWSSLIGVVVRLSKVGELLITLSQSAKSISYIGFQVIGLGQWLNASLVFWYSKSHIYAYLGKANQPGGGT